MKIFLKTEDEIELMRRANQLVGETLAELAKNIKPGVTTLQLDRIAEEFICDHGAIPTFKNFPNPFGGPFPASICTSVNDVVVHGIPSAKTVLRDGDIISVDCGTLLDGYNGDSCYTFAVGEVSADVQQLLITWVILVQQYKTIAKLRVTVWFERSLVMALAEKCTKILLCPTMVAVATVSCWKQVCALPLNL